MYKVVWIVRFRPELGDEAARQRWRGAHAELGRAVPGVERYVQNHPTTSLGALGVEPGRPHFDGYACVWFRDRSSYEAAVGSPEWEAMADDAAELLDIDALSSMHAAVEEHTIIDGDMGPFKAVWMVRFRDEIRADAGLSREAHQYWTSTHGGAFGVKVPGIDRYVQNHVREPLAEDGSLGFDGFSECWFQDRDAFELAMTSREWSEMNHDAWNLFDVDWIITGMSALLDEVTVKNWPV